VVQRYDDGLADVIEKAFPSVAHVTVTMAGGGTAAGTGIVVDDGGLILTNHHVIEGARAMSLVVGVENARVPQGAEIVAGPPAGSTARFTFIRVPGSVVARAPGRDLAIVKAPVGGLAPVELGTATDLRVGQRVIAIGFAFSLRGGPSVTSGIVSGKNRDVELDDGTVYRHLVQTDAAINTGNSGGPLLDVSGRLVGINSVVASAGSAEDIGFAIEVNQALPLIAQVGG
jgi:putative serine protease PepD